MTLQEFVFSAAGNVKHSADGDRSRVDLRRKLLAPFSFKVAALGQLLTSGPYAIDVKGEVPASELADLLAAVSEALLESDSSYAAILIKDCSTSGSLISTTLKKKGFYAMPVDPVMELQIDSTWSSMDDYCQDITSKYRTRYRRARKKFVGLTRRGLTATEVNSRSSLIFELYRETTAGAAYNAANLQADYFGWLASRNQERTGQSGFTGYFYANELIAFTSTIPNGPVLHAHYLGMKEAYKQRYHLYHNILFDLLETAITGKFETLDYGRTALEIKSSVGAVPVDYTCLCKAKSPVLNWMIPFFTPAVYTQPIWQARSPYKNTAL
ncbi:hypothetical protein A3850_015440 [Lewinella sp. 4G2]|nr:hypothetical protein A3850_015440 [Lewinella sp. 4G2]